MQKASQLALLLLLTSGCGSRGERAIPAAAEELVATAVHSAVSAQQVAGQARTGFATLLVAAADSSTAVKKRAHYVCDGQDDRFQIQAAIDALSNQAGAQFDVRGGVVELSAGAFHLGLAIHCRDKVVSLIGAGMGSSELALQDGVNDDILVVGTGTKQGWQSGRIAHLSLNGNGKAQPRGCGIRVLAGLRLSIEDVHVYDCQETGLFRQGLSATVQPALGTIENCHIGYNQKHGVHIGAGIEAGSSGEIASMTTVPTASRTTMSISKRSMARSSRGPPGLPMPASSPTTSPGKIGLSKFASTAVVTGALTS